MKGLKKEINFKRQASSDEKTIKQANSGTVVNDDGNNGGGRTARSTDKSCDGGLDNKQGGKAS